MTFRLSQRLAAEGLGTALLVAVVVGSGIMAETLSSDSVGLALLANTLATGAILFVLITVFGPVSGAHLNPVVSAVFLLRRELLAREALTYAAVQIVGGIAGAWLAHAMFGQPIWQISTHARAGAAQWLSEGVATFALVLTILGTLRSRPEAVPTAVALAIVAGYWFTASTSFANPAVTVARALTNTFAGIAPQHVAGFIAAQFAGGMLAWVVAERLLGFAPQQR